MDEYHWILSIAVAVLLAACIWMWLRLRHLPLKLIFTIAALSLASHPAITVTCLIMGRDLPVIGPWQAAIAIVSIVALVYLARYFYDKDIPTPVPVPVPEPPAPDPLENPDKQFAHIRPSAGDVIEEFIRKLVCASDDQTNKTRVLMAQVAFHNMEVSQAALHLNISTVEKQKLWLPATNKMLTHIRRQQDYYLTKWDELEEYDKRICSATLTNDQNG